MDGLIRPSDLTVPALYEILDADRRQRRRARERTPVSAYEHPDLGDDPQDDPYEQADLNLVRRVAETIELHYPGHPWRIEASHATGVVTIELPPLLVKPACGIVRIIDMTADPKLKVAVRVAGEILERFRLPRQRYDHGDFKAACGRRKLSDLRRGVVPV